MAGEPPDLIVAPHLAHLRLLDFQRAKEAIEEGHRAVQRIPRTTSPSSIMMHLEPDGVVMALDVGRLA